MKKATEITMDLETVQPEVRCHDMNLIKERQEVGVEKLQLYRNILSRRKPALEAIKLLYAMPPLDNDFITLPLNHIFWLYSLGSGNLNNLNVRLWNEAIHALDSAPIQGKKIHRLSNIPITGGYKKAAAKRVIPDVWKDNGRNSLIRMQMLVTLFCFAARGRECKSKNTCSPEASRALRIIQNLKSAIIRLFPSALYTDCVSDNLFTASVSKTNQFTKTMLWGTCNANIGLLYVEHLLENATNMFASIVNRSSDVDLAYILSSMLVYMELSIAPSIVLSQDALSTYSNLKLW